MTNQLTVGNKNNTQNLCPLPNLPSYPPIIVAHMLSIVGERVEITIGTTDKNRRKSLRRGQIICKVCMTGFN